MTIFAIMLLIAGFFLAFAPKLVYAITQSWKNNCVSEPSHYYIVFTRVQGVILVIVGIVCFFAG